MQNSLFTINKVKFNRELSKFENNMKKLAEVSDKTIDDVLKQQAKLFCVDLAFVTQPFGKNLNSKRSGERAIKGDIRNVYLSNNKAYDHLENEKTTGCAKRFYALIKAGKYAEAAKITEKLNLPSMPFDEGLAHQSARKYNGRVYKANPNKFFAYPQKLVEKYIKEIQKRVGMAKSGWYQAAKSINDQSMIKLPSWIKKQVITGRAVHKKSKGVNKIVIYNNVSYVSRIIKDHHIRIAFYNRSRSMGLLAARIIKAKGQKILDRT